MGIQKLIESIPGREEWKSLVRRNPEKSRYVIELSFLFGLILDDFKKLKKI